MEEEIKIWAATDDKNMKIAKESGVTFIEVDTSKFREKVLPMIETAKKDPVLKEYINSIEAM